MNNLFLVHGLIFLYSFSVRTKRMNPDKALTIVSLVVAIEGGFSLSGLLDFDIGFAGFCM